MIPKFGSDTVMASATALQYRLKVFEHPFILSIDKTIVINLVFYTDKC